MDGWMDARLSWIVGARHSDSSVWISGLEGKEGMTSCGMEEFCLVHESAVKKCNAEVGWIVGCTVQHMPL